MDSYRIIGIDFGTSTSAIRVKNYGSPKEQPTPSNIKYISFDSNDTVPTLVYKLQDGSMLYGFDAQNATAKGELYQNFKMDLISDDEQKRTLAGRLTTNFFSYLYRMYQSQKNFLGYAQCEYTRISYPAKWPESLRALLIQIATEVGFPNVEGMDEPTAAMYSVLAQTPALSHISTHEPFHILMLDMGAGTTDLVLFSYTKLESNHQIDVIDVWPKVGRGSLCGGREIDDKLLLYVQKYLSSCGAPTDQMERYRTSCKSWKEGYVSKTLKHPNDAVRYCGFADSIAYMFGSETEFPAIDRQCMESLVHDSMVQLAQMVNDCLDDAGFEAQDVDYVVLTGGHSQWYFWDRVLLGERPDLGMKPLIQLENDPTRLLKISRPQETVAIGLVVKEALTQPISPPETITEHFGFCTHCGRPLENANCAWCKSCMEATKEPSIPVQNATQGRSYSFTAGKSLSGLAVHLEQSMNYKHNMDSQRIDQSANDIILQARIKGGDWRQFVGLDCAITITLHQQDAQGFTVQLGESKWIDKVSAMTVSLFILWPLMVTSGIGMVMQGKLPSQIFAEVDNYLRS